MKYIHRYALFLMLVFCTSCGQNQTSVPKQTDRNHRSGLSESQLKAAAASKVPMSMVRNVRQAKNGDILIASYVGVYRYDGTSFTNMTSTIAWPTFWDVLEDRKGNLWLASQDSGVYFQPADRQALSILKQRMGLALVQRFIFMKTEPVISGSEQAVTMGNLFGPLPQKMDFPVTIFVYFLKTRPASFGLVHKAKICSFMMLA